MTEQLKPPHEQNLNLEKKNATNNYYKYNIG